MGFPTAIPSSFGTGGSGINPTGTGPTLHDLLVELQTQVKSGGAATGKGNPEEISSSGAISTLVTTRLTVSGTKAYTLADGTVGGQRKLIYCVSVASTPVGVVTPAHASGFTTITFGAGSGTSSIELEWDASLGTPAWKVVQLVAVGTVTVA